MGVAPHKNKQTKKKKMIKFGAISILLGVVLYGSYLFYWPLSQIVSEIIHHPGSVLSFIKDPLADLDSTDGRTNILLLGIDKRAYVPFTYKDTQGNVHKNGFLSDTIIVLSVGKDTKDAVLISIPRDTWVQTPGWDRFPGTWGKINSAYSIGNSLDYPGGGLALSEKVVSQTLGIPIHYAARIDFEGFKKTVNTLGGIQVQVAKSFDDYHYPVEDEEDKVCTDKTFSCRYIHIHFNAGLQNMDGETALEFVRSRSGTNGEGSDFARAARQQKVLVAARNKAFSVQSFLNPSRISELFKNLGESIETDFSLNLYPAAYTLLKDVDLSSVKKLVLSSDTGGYLYVPNAADYGGAYVLLPSGDDWTKVQSKVKNMLFGETNK